MADLTTADQNRTQVKPPGRSTRLDHSGAHLPTPHSANSTLISVTNGGFRGTGDEVVEQAIRSTKGFRFVLADLKASLEHDAELYLVRDRMPDQGT